ncbi:MAG: STAS domain-containing protein [Endozoicomonas sp.]
MELVIHLANHGEFTQLNVEGHLDSQNIHLMENALINATRQGNHNIVIDCTHLVSINGDGLKLLFQTQAELAGEFDLSLQNVKDDVADLMELSGVTYFIKVQTQPEQFSA